MRKENKHLEAEANQIEKECEVNRKLVEHEKKENKGKRSLKLLDTIIFFMIRTDKRNIKDRITLKK